MGTIPAVTSDASAFVNFASRDAPRQSLLDGADGIRRYQRWLSKRHPYVVRDIATALGSTNDQVYADKLGDFIACSAPIHLTDGWNFLSRAFEAALQGDRSSAIHMAYYAELRAAMSLLASEGIGIFRHRHIALDAQMQPLQLGGNTHVATWRILQAWTETTDSAARLLDSITLDRHSISTWLDAAGVRAPTRLQLARTWMKTWSIDLARFSEDRNLRNEVSYRPSRIRTKALLPVDAEIELSQPLLSSWEQLEPADAVSMASLDISLLQRALDLVTTQRHCDYSSRSEAVNAFMSSDRPPSVALGEGLRTVKASATLIFDAAKTRITSRPTSAPILGRALLMLRLASATTAALLRDVGLTKPDLRFWWGALGKDLGFWTDADDIDQLADLWDDVRDAIDEVEPRLSAAPLQSSVEFVAGCLAGKNSLTQFTRAPLWLLNLD